MRNVLTGLLKCTTIILNLGILSWKKSEYPSLIISEVMDCEKRWLLKSLKGLASEDHAVINVLTGSKHC